MTQNPKAGQSPRGDLNQQGKRIQELVSRIQSLPDVDARELMTECLQAVLALHGDGLARILHLLENAGAAGNEVSQSLMRDKFVPGMLLIHGLHPVPLEKRLREALDKVRPYMESHGGNVELISLVNDHARLRLEGTCKTCPSSAMTLEHAVRHAVEEACPDLLGFEVDGALVQAEATEHQPMEPAKWVTVNHLGDLKEGEIRLLDIAAPPVVLVKAGGHLYAYRNHCPSCDTTLESATLAAKILTCRAGHRFDVRHAGVSPDDGTSHLDPFPLLSANGSVKIAVK